MPDYNKGKIYKIVDNTNDNIYIGSTCEPTLARRLAEHKNKFKLYLNGKYHFTSSFKILENNDYDIVLLEDVKCENRDQLFQRERYYQDLIPNINKLKNARTSEENKQVKYDSNKAYEKILNKTCVCGGKYIDNLSKRTKHFNTTKHQTYIQAQ
jgi:hypothetical protein